MASVTNYKQNPDELMEDTHSGLVNYLFGKDRKKEINREINDLFKAFCILMSKEITIKRQKMRKYILFVRNIE